MIYMKLVRNKPILHRGRLLVLIGFVACVGVLVRLSVHATGATLSFQAASGVVRAPATIVSTTGTPPGTEVKFGHSGSICGSTVSAPTVYKHVIWIWEENHDAALIDGQPAAPYMNSMEQACATAHNVLDNATTVALPSEPQYAAATSGSNCNVGITTASGSGSNCILNDNDYSSSNTLSTSSIFELISTRGLTWKSYQEGMPANCARVSSGKYAFKHNPAAFYTNISAQCANNDVGIPVLACSTSTGSGCNGSPSGALATDIASGKLPSFAFVTPNLDNDMHDGTVAQADNWLKSYVSLITAGSNYTSGDTALFIMWDEGSANSGSSQTIPTIVIAPSVKPGTSVATMTNNIGLLKTTQEIMGLSPLLGCASGTAPGGSSNCSVGSTTSLASDLNL
jgi:hypothetical protein